jgi:hypothetical protein
MAEPRTRNLNKTQSDLAEAAKANQQEPILTTSDKVVLGGYAPLVTAEAVGGISKALNTPRDISTALRTPMVTSPNVISTASKVATNPLLRAGRVASLTSPLALYTAADVATSMIRDDGKGLSEVTGDVLGGAAAQALYGDGNQSAMSQQERQAIAEGKNPNKPIYGMTGARNQRRRTIVDYEPLSQAAQQSIAQEDTMGGAGAIEVQSPTDRPRNPIVATFTLPDGTVVQERQDGTRFTPTEEQLQSFNQAMEGINQPSVTGLGVGGSEGVVMNQAAQEQFTPQAPEPPSMSELGQRTLANYDQFRASGKPMTPEREQQGVDYAASLGRKFDPEIGYSKEFFPEILQAYNERQGIKTPETPETSEQIVTRQAREAREAREARAGIGDFQRESERRQAEAEQPSDFNQPKIRVGGEMVSATEETRKQRDLEKALGQEAEAEGLSGSAKRQYIADEMQKRSEATADRETKRIMDELNISQSQANLEYKKRQLAGLDAVEKPKSSAVESFVDTADKTFGLKFDPETFTFSSVEEGGFFFRDQEHPLNPNSDRYKKLLELEGSEYFLQAPASIKERAGELAQQAAQSEPNPNTGERFVGVVADDGRVFKITPDGRITHTGYDPSKKK